MSESKTASALVTFSRIWRFATFPSYSTQNGHLLSTSSILTKFPLLIIMANTVTLVVFTRKLFNGTELLALIQQLSVNVVNAAIVLNTVVKHRRIDALFRSLLTAEELVEGFGAPPPVSNTIFKYITAQTSLNLLELVVCFATTSSIKTVLFVLYYVSVSFGHILDLVLALLLLTALHFHRVLLRYLKHKSEYSTGELEHISEAFTALRTLVLDTTEVYGGVLCVKILGDFSSCIVSLFYAIGLLVKDLPLAVTLGTLLGSGLWQVTVLAAPCTIMYLFESIHETEVEILRVLGAVQMQNTHSFRFCSALKLRVWLGVPCFTIAGCVPLNCSLIYAVVAGVTTYGIYLIQFSEIAESFTV